LLCRAWIKVPLVNSGPTRTSGTKQLDTRITE
jgi:hypothetical protein